MVWSFLREKIAGTIPNAVVIPVDQMNAYAPSVRVTTICNGRGREVIPGSDGAGPATLIFS